MCVRAARPIVRAPRTRAGRGELRAGERICSSGRNGSGRRGVRKSRLRLRLAAESPAFARRHAPMETGAWPCVDRHRTPEPDRSSSARTGIGTRTLDACRAAFAILERHAVLHERERCVAAGSRIRLSRQIKSRAGGGGIGHAALQPGRAEASRPRDVEGQGCTRLGRGPVRIAVDSRRAVARELVGVSPLGVARTWGRCGR